VGLELVELVMSVETRFGVDIPDAEARQLTTPAMLIDCVCRKVGAAGDETAVAAGS
jgi:acyl carrier protein